MLIEEAIEEWNGKNSGYCVFVQDDDFENAVTFIKNDDKHPEAHVGYQGTPGQYISLPYPEYPNGY